MTCCPTPRTLAPWITAVTTLLSLIAAAVLATAPSHTAAQAQASLPPRLSQTGLFVPGAPDRLSPQVASFTPQYTLWSDGADKRRWIALPPGTAIDASDPDAWQFPPGTRLWKEFALRGRPVETRYIERRADGQWLFGSYVWDDDGRDARLAPARGAVLPVADAPGGHYEVPGRVDCLACHDSAAAPVLGFSALQLSPDRDPLAVHGQPATGDGLDLPRLVAGGQLQGLSAELLTTPPRIAARSATERAALGYLHANCGHCHNDNGSPAPVALLLSQSVADAGASLQRVLASTVAAPSRYQPAGAAAGSVPVITPGHPPHSALAQRMHSRQPQAQMPPLGSRVPDAEGLALVERWIANDLPTFSQPPQPTQPR